MLIPVHHIVASSSFPVLQTETMEPGYLVALSGTSVSLPGSQEQTGGLVVKCVATDTGDADENPIGLAADKNRAAEAEEWQNRVSDMGQETAASGMLTVYHGGGEFWVDIDAATGESGEVQTPGGTVIRGVVDPTAVVTVGSFLRRHAGGAAESGRMDDATPTNFGDPVAVVVSPSQELETGIPGEFEPGATFELADDDDNRNFIKIKLLL